jgi:hypothetical protein
MSDSKKPAARIKLYPVSAAIWRNETQKGVFWSVTFERSYKDEAGNWQSSDNFNTSELLLVSKVADLAHSEIFKLRVSDRHVEPTDEEAA